MTAEYIIRGMQKTDLDAVYAIECETFPNPWCRQSFVECLVFNECLVLCLSSADEVIGYIIGVGLYEEYHIYNIAIKPKYQSKGAGSFILKWHFMQNKGKYEYYLLECRKGNETAIAFYKKHGFDIIAERKQYYTDPTEDALVMKLTTRS